MKDKYDVIVVGAGPAGSIAAKTCAEGKLDVLLIEKRQEIGDPVRCAEGVSKDGLEKHIRPDKKWIAAEVKGSKIIAPDGNVIKLSENLKLNCAGYVLERKVFDRALAQQAAMAGAEVRVKTRATGLLHDNGKVAGIYAMCMGEMHEIRADIVIGADGVESKVGRWGGIDTSLKPYDIDTCAQFLVYSEKNIDDGEYSEFYIGERYAPGGYAWVFPKGKHTANVGLGLLGSKSGGARAATLLKDFVQNNMPDAKILEMVVGGVPVSGVIKQTVADGLMLVGDAARQSDPLTGGGIINAMDAGKIAGEVCIKAKQKKDFSVRTLKEYEERWWAEIGEGLSNSLIVKNLLIELTDRDLNTLAKSLDGIDTSKMQLLDLLEVMYKMNPELLLKLKPLITIISKKKIKKVLGFDRS